jgi:hypothetical protein
MTTNTRMVVGLVCALATIGAAATPAMADSGEKVFSHSCDLQQFTVPDDVHWLYVDVEGGHGGQGKRTGPGGTAGAVHATISVNPRDKLSVSVGEFGWFSPGCGPFSGGDRGGADGPDSEGQDGASGASGSAVYGPDDEPLVIAGGGGGGGGDSGNDHEYGGPGGAAGKPPQDGVGGQGGGGASGGRGGCEDHARGGTGETTDNGWGGGAGGGGGGYRGGCGGHANSNGGGGGGGGGSSWAATGVTASYSTSTRHCPYDDSKDVSYWGESCDGRVTLSWDSSPGSVTVAGGSGQSTAIDTPFTRALQAKVADADGRPIGGAAVTFTLAGSGASATFRTTHTTTATVKAGADGVATSPAIDANDIAGGWTAEATASGTRGTARYSLTNAKATTQTEVASSADPAVAGQAVRFTATVHPDVTLPSPAPRGAITFVLEGAGTSEPIGAPVALDDAGQAVSDPVVLGLADHPIGDYHVRADYNGDANHEPGTGSGAQSVVAASTATAIRAWKGPGVPGNPSTGGEDIYFTATVTPQAASTGHPTGTVQFSVNGAPFGDPSPVDAATGVATSITTAEAPVDPLVPGDNTVTATYTSADTSFRDSNGSMTESVGADATAVTLSSSADPAVYGDPVTLTAQVRRSDAGETPRGQAGFSVDGTTVCTAAPVVDGVASCDLPEPLDPGSHQIRADYTADPTQGLQPSHDEMVQTVAAASSSARLTALPTPSVFGGEVRLRAAIDAAVPAGDAGGQVQFSIDGTALGAPVAVADGVAVSAPAPIEVLPPGLHVLGADYTDPDGRILPSRAETIQHVERAPTSLTLTSSADPAAPGEPITFTAAISAPGQAQDGPFSMGDVRFRVDGVTVGEVIQVHDGVAVSDPIAGLGPGTHEVVAEHSGSVAFGPSQNTLSQTVWSGPAPPASNSASTAPTPGPPLPPAPPPADVAPVAVVPVPRAELVSTRVRVSERGVATIAVRCTGAATGRCHGQVVLGAAQRRLGARTVEIATGRIAHVDVYLNGRGRQVLSRRGRASVTARVAPSSGTAATGAHRITLLATRAPAATISARTAAVDDRGRLGLRVRCGGQRPERCRGWISVTGEHGATAGRRRIAVPSGATRLIHVAVREEPSAGAQLRVRTRTTVEVGRATTRSATVRVADR